MNSLCLKGLSAILFFSLFLLACSTQFVHVQTASWFRISPSHLYPSLAQLPLVYPLNNIDPSTTNNQYQGITYVPLDPINAGATSASRLCSDIQGNPVPTDALGHCFPICTQYSIASGLSLGLNYTQIFCLAAAQTYISTFQQYSQQLNQVQPEYMVLNCTDDLLLNNALWYSLYPTYDPYYVQSISGTGVSKIYAGGVHAPTCLASNTCFHSQGLPRSPFDGPNKPLQQTGTRFYCCRTGKQTAQYAVMYDYTCVATQFPASSPTTPSGQATYTRQVQVLGTLPPGQSLLSLSWSQTEFSLQGQCVGPWFTDHASLQQYDPQPTSIGCAASDLQDLCTLNVQDGAAGICTNNEQVKTLYHYTTGELETMGFDARGKYDILLPGVPDPSVDLTHLFEARTWDNCQNGQLGCTVYCHCWTGGKFGGCPKHPACNSHGTLRESPSLGVRMRCKCDPGFYGNKCQFRVGTQLCGNSARTSTDADAMFFK